MRTKQWITRGLIILLALGVLAAMGGLLFMWIQYKRGQTTQPASEPPPLHTAIDEEYRRMNLRDKVASLFIFHTPGTDARHMTAYVQQHKPGGMIFMGDNIPDNPEAISALTQATTLNNKIPQFTAIDEEGGTVKRLADDTYPSAEALRNEPPAATKEAFGARSQLLKQHGFNLNFGIVADVTNDQTSFIYPRVLGTTTEAASERVRAGVEGSAGITLSTLKHFPGHGETVTDSHTSIPTASTTIDDWRARVALPFRAGVDAGADMVMTGHLRYNHIDPQPASLSKKWHDILRNELKFEGIIITDDMLMLQQSGEAGFKDPVKNAVSALTAGSDMLLYVIDHGEGTQLNPTTLIDGVMRAIDRGTLDKKSVEEAAKKVLTLRYNLRTE